MANNIKNGYYKGIPNKGRSKNMKKKERFLPCTQIIVLRNVLHEREYCVVDYQHTLPLIHIEYAMIGLLRISKEHKSI